MKLNRTLILILIGLLVYSSSTTRIFADENNTKSDAKENTTKNTDTDDSSSDRNDKSDINEKLDIDLSQIKVDDSFKSYSDNEYIVSQVNKSNIKINGNKVDIYNFEIYAKINNSETWRKFVKLNDLCKDKNVCELLDDKTDIVLKRTSSLNGKILDDSSKKLDTYYRTVYDGPNKQFKSVLIIGETFFKFNSDANENSKFNTEGVLTSDVETLTDKNGDLYVSLRFVTEALGAEVKWTAAKQGNNDTVEINFYDNEKYCKNINTSFSESCKNVDENTLNKIKKCDTNDSTCQSDRCKTYIKNNLNNKKIDDLSLNIDYNYIDENSKIRNFKADWKKKDIYLSTDKDIDGYGIILYKSVPLLIDIFNGVDSDECINTIISFEEAECIEKGNKWITDEVYIKLQERDKPYCAINLNEQVSTSAEK